MDSARLAGRVLRIVERNPAQFRQVDPRREAISVKLHTSLLVFSPVFRVVPAVAQPATSRLARLEYECKTNACCYIVFRQSPNRDLARLPPMAYRCCGAVGAVAWLPPWVLSHSAGACAL